MLASIRLLPGSATPVEGILVGIGPRSVRVTVGVKSRRRSGPSGPGADVRVAVGLGSLILMFDQQSLGVTRPIRVTCFPDDSIRVYDFPALLVTVTSTPQDHANEFMIAAAVNSSVTA